MSFPLTEEQRQVVNDRGGGLLVSAAAGSGKTRVLVERLLDRVVRERKNIDQFLIITYTRAAAAELRARIAEELNVRLAEHPEDRHLRRQTNLVYKAQISTIHAFCADLLVGGHRVGESVSAWVMMNRDTGRIVKLSTVSELRETGGGSLCKERTLSKIRFPQGMAPVERRLMRYSDSDINGHVNNTKYADFVCDAIHLDRREKGEFVSEIQIGYLAQCWPNEEIEIRTARWDGGWFVGGEDEACTPRFEACVRLSSEA